MSKLQRTVDGQTIQFLPLPKIFNTLSADLPSGAVKLPNGEVAHWRLHRNLAELKKYRKNLKELTAKLANALQALVNSDSFKNHYGLTEAPSIPSESQLVTLFRNLLQLNTNRVDYSSVSHGRNKPLVETIQVPLGNLVWFNAIRGVQNGPKVDGIKGKLWLKEGSDADQAFEFTIVSPVVDLADFIGPDRLQAEILSKIKQNLPALAFNPKLTFADGQFKNYVGAGLQALGEKFNNGNVSGKKKEKAKKEQPAPQNPASEIEQPASPSLEEAVNQGAEDLIEAAAEHEAVVEQLNAAPADTPITMNAHQAAQVASDARDAQRTAELGTVVLAASVFEELSNEDKGVYLASVERKIADPAQWPFVKKVLNSGILAEPYKNLNDTLDEGEKITQALYIARVIFQMTNDQYASIVGETELAKA